MLNNINTILLLREVFDMENENWIFEGIDTALFSLTAGLFLGRVIGFRIGIHNKVEQT